MTGDFRVGGCHHSIWEVIPPKFILLVSVQGYLSSVLSFLAVQEHFFPVYVSLGYYFSFCWINSELSGARAFGSVVAGSWVISHDLTPDLRSVWEGGKFFWVIWFCANEVGSTIKWYQD